MVDTLSYAYLCIKQITDMKITKLSKGTYKVVDAQGTWIARGGEATVNGMWTANDCDNVDDLSSDNNWAVEFKTFAQLKKYSQSF